MFFKVLIFTSNLDFPAGKKLIFWKNHTKTPCKILDDLKKLSPRHQPIFQKPPQCKMHGIQKMRPCSFKLIFFTCGQLFNKLNCIQSKTIQRNFYGGIS